MSYCIRKVFSRSIQNLPLFKVMLGFFQDFNKKREKEKENEILTSIRTFIHVDGIREYTDCKLNFFCLLYGETLSH